MKNTAKPLKKWQTNRRYSTNPQSFPDFEELDGDYYDVADEDLETAAAYVQANWDKFAKLSD